jgi:hypothetical protein
LQDRGDNCPRYHSGLGDTEHEFRIVVTADPQSQCTAELSEEGPIDLEDVSMLIKHNEA